MALATCRDCGQQISTAASQCPHCGRPVSRSGSTPAAKGCLIAIGVLVLFGIVGSISRSCDEKKSEEVRAQADADRQRQEDAAKKARVARISAATLASIDLAKDCMSNAAAVPASVQMICRDSELLLAKERTHARDAVSARAALTAAVKLGAQSSESGRLDKQIAKIEREEQRKREIADAAAAARARKAYGAILRERFLDTNMDVKVEVSGRNNDHITLRWALFNDVWTHKMQKPDGLVPELKALGFRRVDVTDGYDYRVYWDLK